MASQYVWIGIIVAVFIAGLAIGSIIQQNNSVTPMTPQQMQQMMNNPQAMNQWMNAMMDNPQTRSQMMALMANNPQMNSWMQDPEYVKQMTELMRNNHDFMQEMMKEMINDPNLRLQMLGHMSENPEMMEQMQNIMEQGNMGSRMMSPQSLCQQYDGNWLPEFNECEAISSEQCSIMNGTFKECESACRHIPDAEVCTKQCVPVCVIP